MKKRALISVSNKTGVVEFAKALDELGYEIISTGGTKKALEAAGLKTIGISDVTGFPEILDGRVKTLHPNVHGALLAVRDNEAHIETLKKQNIEFIDIVCVNLYPFKETIARGAEFAEAIENIDIGGPSMLRSASKNHKFITVVCDNEDYAQIIEEIKATGNTTYETRLKLAAKAFSHTACYDALISKYMNEKAGITAPKEFAMGFNLKQELRYGENPHQGALFYAAPEKCDYSLAASTQLHGKELSYNNIQDANATLDLLREFSEPAVVACKHMNPCGVGIGENINEAWDKAYASDDKSIFGGIIATNQTVTKEVAEKMSQIFLELIIAPGFDQDALDILTAKKNIRLMTCPMNTIPTAKKFVSVNGGVLLQDPDNDLYEDLQCVTEKKPTDDELRDLIFGYKIVKHVKSNAIVLTKDGMTVGVGAGQMNRSGAAEIAMKWAKANGRNTSVLSSDAFFPFGDTVELAHEYGVTAIIQPGGSIRDQESIDACNKYGIAMIFTNMRHFKH